MDKSSGWNIGAEEQRQAWNKWNSNVGRKPPNSATRREWQALDHFLTDHGLLDQDILEVGCGAAWLSEQLMKYGRVTGIDLSDEILAEASLRLPKIRFISGDFYDIDLPEAAFDIVVSKDTLSHVGDQPGFIARCSTLLRKGGYLLLITQNKPVFERWSAISGPQPGQLRHWLDSKTLRAMLRPYFTSVEMTSVYPVGDTGWLRLINSYKLNFLLSKIVPVRLIERAKERAMLGHSLVAFARK